MEQFRKHKLQVKSTDYSSVGEISEEVQYALSLSRGGRQTQKRDFCHISWIFTLGGKNKREAEVPMFPSWF